MQTPKTSRRFGFRPYALVLLLALTSAIIGARMPGPARQEDLTRPWAPSTPVPAATATLTAKAAALQPIPLVGLTQALEANTFADLNEIRQEKLYLRQMQRSLRPAEVALGDANASVPATPPLGYHKLSERKLKQLETMP